MKRIMLLSALAGCLFASCKRDGYNVSGSGLQYIIREKTDGRKPEYGDILQLKFAYRDAHDSLLYNSEALSDSLIMEFKNEGFDQMSEAIGMLSEGDSATFLFPADSIYVKVFNSRVPAGLGKNDKLRWDVRLMRVFTRDQFKRVIQQRIENTAALETRIIRDYLLKNNIAVDPLPSGLTYISFEEGKGDQPMPGDTVVVKYTGLFLSGEIFDSSDKGSGSVRFRLGDGTMVKGWDEGIRFMREGGRARLVLPSRLAYGLRGFGPIPPDTPVIYEVELMKVYSAAKGS